MRAQRQVLSAVVPSDVARYYLYRASTDGELLAPLKMQKLVYYAYVHTLIECDCHLFPERMEAWPMGPVAPSLYRDLKCYGSSPIGEEFLGLHTQEELDALTAKFPQDVLRTLDRVYEDYIVRSAFELVVRTHQETAWRKARAGLAPNERSSAVLSDHDIIAQHGSAE